MITKIETLLSELECREYVPALVDASLVVCLKALCDYVKQLEGRIKELEEHEVQHTKGEVQGE